MAKIAITGGGIVGLLTSMLLARDGHDVTVFERDPTPAPADVEEAWASWTRTGVNQFRMLHYFLPRFRVIVEAELPELVPSLEAAGALRFNPMDGIPVELTGGFQPGDEFHAVITGRRPVFESVIARAADEAPRVEVRRGVEVAGLLVGVEDARAVPNVTGVRTVSGEEFRADLVVDMTGRRSPLPRWLADLGARLPTEELEDSGFLYYGRHFRSGDGSVPIALGGLLQHYGSVSTLTLPADNGTWGVGVITSAKDAPLRSLRDAETWTRVVQSFPLVAHWVDGEPLDESPAVMAKIEDRRRRFCIDGTPVATGVVAVSDSWACTNPSLGRGMSIGLMHGVALRDMLRDDLDGPRAIAVRWNEITDEVTAPWYESTLAFDRHRLAEIEAIAQGGSYETDDPVWELTKAMQFAAGQDPVILRAFLSIVGLGAIDRDVFARPGFAERVTSVGGDWRAEPSAGPDREALLGTVGAAAAGVGH
jgi:2-polyprenyl-6-methoxyphenol hydroxylase-like FAD-dependent oxidoreductase